MTNKHVYKIYYDGQTIGYFTNPFDCIKMLQDFIDFFDVTCFVDKLSNGYIIHCYYVSALDAKFVDDTQK